ncbi:MAG: PqqD family peptide modification chaperone, partial [bacterium]|nr:PqqD family peptide modification chaperone [bacterium]
MKESLFSPYWYRVANLRPQLRQHVQIHRHEYRGELWYVLQDHASGRFHRFGPVAYYVVGLMDGQRTVQELWELAIAHFNEEAPSQNDMVQLLSQLHTADALITSVAPDIAELLERSFRSSQSRWKQQILSPLFVRIPLWDPNRFLSNTLPYFRPFLGRLGFGLWLLIVVFAAGLALFHWQELTENVIGRILTMQNLLLLSLLFPLVKVLHEFGHAYAVKRWGGEVHEMGVMLLVLMPIPYVEASAANAFRDKRQRMVVSAAGMMVELLLASIAFFIWLNMEEGLLRTLLYNTIFISSVSTILFNANPLLRYDGYYILADWLEIPNLAQKGMQYLGYLCKRYLLGLRHLIPPHITSRESLWLVGYTVAAFFYRIFVYAAIVLFIASRFFFVGILLAFWSTIAMFGLPLMKLFRFLFTSSALHERRARALVVTGLVIGVIGWALFV